FGKALAAISRNCATTALVEHFGSGGVELRKDSRAGSAKIGRGSYNRTRFGHGLGFTMSEERSREFESFDEPASNLPLLDKLDRVIASLPPGDPVRRDLLDLRPHVSDQSQMIGEARQMIEKLEEVIKKVTSPANRIGTFLGATSKDTAHIVVGGADYYCNVDPRIPLAKLKKGTRVLVNEAFVIVGDLGFETAGPVAKITEVIGEDRLRVGSEHGTHSMVLQRSADLATSALKSGDEVRVDSNYRMALEMLSSAKSHEHYLD